jgi:hypothetical protein
MFALCARRTGEFADNRTKIDLVAPQTGYDVLFVFAPANSSAFTEDAALESQAKPRGLNRRPAPARSFAHFAW